VANELAGLRRRPGPEFVTVELPEPVDVTSFEIDPASGCGSGTSAGLAGYRVEVSADGITFKVAATGTLTQEDAFRANVVTPAGGPAHGARFVRLVGVSTLNSEPGFGGARSLVVTEFGVYGQPADRVAPDTRIDSGPEEGSSGPSRDAVFTFSSEPGAGFECSLDGRAWESCSSPRAYGGLATGPHLFEVRARDAAGNVDASPGRRGWSVHQPIEHPDTTTEVPRQPIEYPDPTTAVPRQRLGAVLSRGLRVHYVCWGPCSLRWRLDLTAREARRLGLSRRQAGSASVSHGGFARRSAMIKLKRRVRQALRRKRRVSMMLTTIVEASGKRETTTRRITLRR
jgi:hypothetical protein